MNRIHERLLEFKNKYPFTIGRRLKYHAKVIEKHLSAEEEVIYVFYGQKSVSTFDIFNTYVCVLTDKRILIATKRTVFGYLFKSITPDMFNDLTVKVRLIWGQVWIDTIKEMIKLSNIQKNALPEIEQAITEQMKRVKRGYKHTDSEMLIEHQNH